MKVLKIGTVTVTPDGKRVYSGFEVDGEGKPVDLSKLAHILDAALAAQEAQCTSPKP